MKGGKELDKMYLFDVEIKNLEEQMKEPNAIFHSFSFQKKNEQESSSESLAFADVSPKGFHILRANDKMRELFTATSDKTSLESLLKMSPEEKI